MDILLTMFFYTPVPVTPINPFTPVIIHRCTDAQMYKCKNINMEKFRNTEMHHYTAQHEHKTGSLHKTQVKSIALCTDFKFAQF